MADGFSLDMSDFERLEADLRDAPREAAGDVVTALAVNAGKVKASWREKLQGNEYAPRVPFSIDYEQIGTLTALASGVEFEIGARKGSGKQGGVALLLEFGAPARGLTPRGFGAASLAENEGDLVEGVTKAIDSALRKVGL